MKKLLLLFVLSIFTLALIGCDGTGELPTGIPNITEVPTTEQPTTVEPTTGVPTTEPTTELLQLDMVDNLSIDANTKVLSWSAVTDAIGYEVYLNGELVTQVSTTSYDFSGVTGDQFIFSIIAVAPLGMSNSQMSPTLAYVANEDLAVQAMILALNNGPLFLSDTEAFATELVNKGMTADDMNSMMEEILSLESIDMMEELSDVFNLVDGVIQSMDMLMIEAFISALIKVELPITLEEQLEYYQSMTDNCGVYDEYCSFRYSEDIRLLENMLSFLETNTEGTIASVMVMIEYLMAVETAIDLDMINDLEAIINNGPFEEITVSLIVSLKNSFVTNLKTNLPSLEEMVLLNSTLLAFVDAMTNEFIDFSMISVSKQAEQELLMLELVFNFLLEIDSDYVNSYISIITGATDYNIGFKTFIKENLLLLDRFLDNNALIIDELSSIMTNEELEEIFIEVIMIPLMVDQYYQYTYYQEVNPDAEQIVALLVREYINFDDILLLNDSLSDSMNQLLDAIIASDFKIIDDLYELIMFGVGGEANAIASNDDYIDLNFYINVELEPGEYELLVKGLSPYASGNFGLMVLDGDDIIIDKALYLNPGQEYIYDLVITETTIIEASTTGDIDTIGYIFYKDETLRSEVEVVTSTITEMFNLLNPMVQDLTMEEYSALIDIIISNVYLQVEIVNLTDNDMTDYLDIMAYFVEALENTKTNQLNIIQNTMDVLDNTAFIDDLSYMFGIRYENESTYYAQGIAFANLFLEVYSVNESDINLIIDEVITTLSQPDMMALLNLSIEDISRIENDIAGYMNNIVNQATVIKDYNPEELTETQLLEVEDYIYMLEDFGIYIYYPTDGPILDDQNFFISGNITGWYDFNNLDYLMVETSIDEPFFEGYYEQLQYATEIYVTDIVIPYDSAGWTMEYMIDGEPMVFDGNQAIKFVETINIDGENIPMYWGPSPESGQIMNLTPETLFIPEYIDPNSSEFDPDLGTGSWNDNPVVYEPGDYYMVLARIDGQLWFGAISKETSQPSDTIKVGNTAPTSGPFAMMGVPFNNAILAVFEQYNQMGGLNGMPIEFIHYDDQFDPILGMAYTEELIFTDDVFAIVGHFGTPTVSATFDLLVQYNVPMVHAVTAINELYMEDVTGSPLIPVQPIMYVEGKMMVARALTEQIYGMNHNEVFPSNGKIAVFYTDEADTGQPIKDGISDELFLLGFNPENVIFLPISEDNISDQLSTASNFEADVILTAMTNSLFIATMFEMESQNIQIPVFTTHANSNAYFLGVSYSPNRPIYNNGWLDIDITSADFYEYVNVIMNSSILDEATKQSMIGNPFAIAGYIAATTFIEGLNRIEESGLELTVDNYIALMEAFPISIPMAGDLDLSDGNRFGADSLSLLQYMVGDNPDTVEIETNYVYYVTVSPFESLEEIEAKLAE